MPPIRSAAACAARRRFRPAPGPGAVLLLVSVALCVLSGCRRAPEATPVIPPEQTQSPRAVAAAVLETIGAELDAIARRDHTGVRAARARLVQLAASAEIAKMIRSTPRLGGVLGDRPAEGYVELWGAVVSFYRGGIALSEAWEKSGVDDAHVSVFVPARVDRHSTVIELDCVRGDDQRWRVRKLMLVPPALAAAHAASQPASASSASDSQPDSTKESPGG